MFFLSPKWAEGGGAQSLGDMFSKNSSFFTLSLLRFQQFICDSAFPQDSLSYLPLPSLTNPHQLQGRTTALSCLHSHVTLSFLYTPWTLYLFMYTYRTWRWLPYMYTIRIVYNERISVWILVSNIPLNPVTVRLLRSYRIVKRKGAVGFRDTVQFSLKYPIVSPETTREDTQNN